MDDAELVEEGHAVPMSVGERLREAREAAGLSLEDIATSTRIPTRHLESIEASDFSRLPGPTYTVGFAKNFAGAVGLDRAEIGEQLRAEMGGTRPISTTTDVFEPADPARAMPKWLIFGAIGGILLVVLLFNWLNNRSLEEPDEVATTNAIAAAPPLAVRAWRQNLLDMSMPLVTKSLHDELSAQMLIYKSDDFAEFKRARAEGRSPVYRTT